MFKVKVLIVDDELPIRENLRMFTWEEYGYELVGEARHGREALKKCEELCPQIVITDIVMPVMDGLELAKEIKQRDNGVQIIFLTCHSDFEYARQAIIFEANDYLLKGIYRDEELLAALERSRSKLASRLDAECAYRYEIEHAISYIAGHLDKEIDMAQVAEHVGLSKNYFGSLFKRETGMYFQEYINLERLNKAASYLKRTNLKVYEIAEKVGYPNYRYFSDLFTKHFGASPRDYRGEVRRSAEVSF